MKVRELAEVASKSIGAMVKILLPNIKKWFQEQRFSSNEEVKRETDGYFGRLDKSYYKRGIEMLKHLWTKY